MSAFTKVRMLSENWYQEWKNHKCNENKVERMDMLNKKYADSILSEGDITEESAQV